MLKDLACEVSKIINDELKKMESVETKPEKKNPGCDSDGCPCSPPGTLARLMELPYDDVNAA